MFPAFLLCLFLSAWAALLGPTDATADEGMWTFDNVPKKLLQEKYGFEPGDQWLLHLQQSAVRFNSGGSGSFVSSQGLVMTNHHVGADALQKLSQQGADYVALGFHAKTTKDELKCHDLELNVLVGIEDVTDRVNAAVKKEMSGAEAEKARRAAMNTIEKESLDKSGLRSDVVTLYQGGKYHLYRYKKYVDVRLVFAPEKDIAFFGGDPDNFEYPRYDLDICFFRAYENDQPAKVEHFLRWSAAGARDGELIFVAGHPGHTDRLNTAAHLEFLRDTAVPFSLNLLRRREVLLKTFSERSVENARRAQDELFGYQNSRKARLGMLAGLQDPAVMERKHAEERALREAIGKDEKLRAAAGSAWDEVQATLAVLVEIRRDYNLLELGQAFNSRQFQIARTLLRLAEESAKPNADRLREYRESNLESLQQDLFSEAPIYDDVEVVALADSLGMLVEMAGANDPLVRQTLSGKSPRQRAAELVQGTRLKDVALRKQLAQGGQTALAASDDPMIQLARLVDPAARQVRKRFEQEVDEPQRQAYAKIAQARFQLAGTSAYPDATFTLRLAFGVVKGYEELGKQIPPWTVIGGAFAHAEAHGHKEPFALPKRWMERKNRINLNAPFNFVSTADIIGGNSGSPVVNRAGELVGIIFDGNLPGLVLDFAYTDDQARAVSVHSAGIVEALRGVYDARELAGELGR